MKHVTAITVAALMLACVLPMAQAQAPASDEVKHVRSEEDNQSSEDIAALELRLQELMAQQQELQKQLQALAETRSEVRADRQMRGEAQERPRVRHVPEGLTVAPPEPRTAPGGGPPVRPEAREERIPHVQDEQQWVAQIEAWAEQLEQWEHSEEMLKWEQDMEKWGEQMGRWGQELARRQTDASADSSEMPQIAPMPALPPLPQMSTMAHVSTTPPGKMAEHAVPHPTTPRPHTAEGVTPHVTTPQIHVPHVEIPHIEMPVVAPPAIPEKEEGQEEAVSRTEHDIDLPTGRLLEVKNDMGSIAVRGSNEPGCKLVVTVKGRAETMEEARRIVEQVELVVTPSQDKVFITTTDPQSDNRQERANRVVAMEIVVPHDARVTLGQAFGDIRLAGLDGVIKAVTNMGSIRAADVRGRIALEVNFGNIDFTAPGDFSAKVQAKAQFGSIRSDLPLEIVKAAPFSMGGKAAGIIGDGQSDLSLTTNMGSIHIRKQAGESEHLF